jgi:hypothetical protein
VKVVAVDPGPEQSALIVWDGERVHDKVLERNQYILARIHAWAGLGELVLEQVACFGMPVGAEVFETVFWTGRFYEVWGDEHNASHRFRLPRMAVKMHLCHTSRAKDANIRQALVDRLGKPGTKKQPGITYGIKQDLWAALALAVTWWDQNHA